MKPVATRRSEVEQKFAYATARRHELSNQVFEAQAANREPAFLSQTAADVIATARECFDYLGQDIIECFVVPASDQHRKMFEAGKLKSYFPFHEKQLTDVKSTFHVLKQAEPQLYRNLVAFTKASAANDLLPNTRFRHGTFLQMKDMVNAKKHNQLVKVLSEDQGEILLVSPGLEIRMTKKEQKGWDVGSLTVPPGTEKREAVSYSFELNGEEVTSFCLAAVEGSARVIRQIYSDHFAAQP